MNVLLSIESIFYAVALTVPILLFALLRRNYESDHYSKSESLENDQLTPNDRFFSSLSQCPKIVLLVRTYSPTDKYMIQSILDSYGIPSYLSSQHVNNLLPGVRIKGHTDSTISIDKKDLLAATIFVLEYIDSLIESNRRREGLLSTSIYNSLAFLHSINTSAGSYLPELLIDVDELLRDLETGTIGVE